MITIENIKKLGEIIGAPMTTLTHETHYEFIVGYDIKTYNITLSRFSPPTKHATDTNRGKYLMLCRSDMIWFTKDELKDVVKVSKGIYQILSRIK